MARGWRGVHRARRLAAMALALPLAACGAPEPAGQVLAIVGGEEVTQRELLAEGGQAVAGSGSAERLDRLIERKLLARIAEREALDRTPEVLFGLRRAREELLVERLRQHLRAEVAPPPDDRIARFVDERPWMFARRAIVTLDPAGAEGLAGGQRLQIDTATLPEEPGAQLAAVRPGAEVNLGGQSYRVAARQEAPVTGPAAMRAARRAIVYGEADKRLQALLQEELSHTRVQFQSGFGPSGGR